MTLTLKPFQVEGVKHLTRLDRPRPHRLLLDDPGLGKTVQAAAGIKKLNAKKVLVLCPAPVKRTWRRELIDWGACKSDDIFIVNQGRDIVPPEKNVIIVNYDFLYNEEIDAQLRDRQYHIGCMDEVQRLKNLTSRRSESVLAWQKNGKVPPLISHCIWKWGFSGTLMPNRPIEIFPVASALARSVLEPFDTWETFGEHFCQGFREKFGGYNFNGSSNEEDLRKRLFEWFCLRRQMKDVWQEMPPAVHTRIYLDIGDLEEDETNTPMATLRRVVGLKKVPFIVEYVKDQKTSGSLVGKKLLIFAYHRDVIDQLCDGLKEFGVLKLMGGLTSTAKDATIDGFIHDDKINILVAQMISAGEGIDGWQKICHHMLFAESDWCPEVIRQAIGRLKRLGQPEDAVYVTEMVAENTLDDPMGGVRHRKRKVINTIFNQPNKQGENSMSCDVQGLVDAITNLVNTVNQLVQDSAAPAAKATAAAPATNPKPAAAPPKGATTADKKGAGSAPAAAKATDKKPAGKKKSEHTPDEVKTKSAEALKRLKEVLGDDKEAMRRIKEPIEAAGGKALKDVLTEENADEFWTAFEGIVAAAEAEAEGGGEAEEEV